MLFKSNLFRVIGVLCLTLSLSFVALADTIRLKDGSIIKGKIVSFGSGRFTVMIGSRQMNFSASEVESISFDTDSTSASNLNTSSNSSTVSGNNSTIITVGQSSQTNTTQTNTTPVNPQPKTNSNPPPTTTAKPIEISVKVLADNTANGWSNSGWVVRKGQKIRITGTGRISLGSGRYTTPNGIASLSDKDKLMAQEATGGLIAVIGDNNNDFIFVGDTREFIATRDGALFLGINEGNLDDNSGVFDVKIEISPESGS